MAKYQSFTHEDVKLVTKRSLHKGFLNLSQYQLSHKLHQGGWSDTILREVVEKPDAVAVLPYDPQLEQFVLIEQFRVGAIGIGASPWLLECVAGINDKDEDPESLCRRELFEEAGLETTHLIKALSYFSSPGATTEYLHVFIGIVDAANAGGVHGVEDENEDILVHCVPKEQVRQWLSEGKINNAATVIALQWFFLNQEQVAQAQNNHRE